MDTRKLCLLLAAVSPLLLPACQKGPEVAGTGDATTLAATADEAPGSPEESIQKLESGIDWSGFNTDVRPQDDLFEYANGKWVAEAELPPDRARWGSFDRLRDQAEADVRALVEEVSRAEDVQPGSATQKIRDFYNAYMDTDAVNAAGLAPIEDGLEAIAAIDSYEGLFRAFSKLGIYGVESPIGGGIFSDLKDPDTNVVYLAQSGLTLPDRDYYLKDDPQFVEGRRLYREYVTRLFELSGEDNAAHKADVLYELEHRLAEAHWTKEDNRDPVLTYNPVTPAELRDLAPNIDWDATLEAAEIPARERYIVQQPGYFEAAGRILEETDLETWKDYLRFKTISNFAPLLSEPFFAAWFDFFRAGLQGIDEPRPRWKRAVNSINAGMGELLGQLYVDKHYQEASRERMEEMISNLIEAYRRSISELSWMGEETRQQALEKLSKFNPKIGYPDAWRDYSGLQIVPGDLVANIKAARRFEYRRNVNKLDRPVDKDEWFLTPQTVNAYYNPAWNEIVFPAAILQPPFFNVKADDAVNYGAIGAVIGHEIGHGFDDKGRKFDGDGNLRDWWTPEDNERFEARAAKLAAQYDGYEVIDGLTINGEFTSGENIGDLGGLGIAYEAYRLSLDGEEAPVLDGLTGDQRFFLGWAQLWRAKARDAETKRLLTIDPHSPPKFRANGAAVNVQAFYDAFDIGEGDGMYLPPEERVNIW